MRHRQEAESVTVPCWSGVPLTVGNVMIVPLHVSDWRTVIPDQQWSHVGFFEAVGGEVEYHIYQRGKSVPQVSESLSDYIASDVWGAIPTQPTAESS